MRRKIKTNFCMPRAKILAALFFPLLLCLSHPALAQYESLKLLASDANADDRFGVSVAIDGNTVVVGAYQTDSNGLNSGAVYVYELSGSQGSQWVEKQKLVASDASAGAQFGRSVAISGDTIIIGSYRDANTGSAYVFTRSGEAWSQQQKLNASDAAANDKFGGCVSIDNNTIVIGAYGDNAYTGAAYVFVRYGSTWTQQQKLTASDFNQNNYFGYSVSVDNNTILVGAYGYNSNAGTVYVFVPNGPGWSQDSKLTASDSNNNDLFGWSVAIDGNWAVISSYGYHGSAGAAFIFERNGSSWLQRQKLVDLVAPNAIEIFGSSVAICDGKIVAGCMNDSVANQNTGSAYSFILEDSAWIYDRQLLASDACEADEFGSSVALSTSHVIIGSLYSDANGPSSGSAYVFDNIYSLLVCDFDGDNDVDFCDFAKLASSWLQNDPLKDIAPPEDIVNIDDLAVFADNWLWGK